MGIIGSKKDVCPWEPLILTKDMSVETPVSYEYVCRWEHLIEIKKGAWPCLVTFKEVCLSEHLGPSVGTLGS
jgi:hypothetical protein